MQTLHIISHTHWDREWYQTFQQFRLRLVHLVDKLLDILDADPDFKYFMLDGQTIVLDDYLLMRPEMEETLRGHIQSGRILIGPWHILPDMFLVSPEAHIRNLLAGERESRKWGSKMSIGYMPDSFGHIGQMPQILSGFGIDNACLWRGLDDQPAEFWWQSPDGTRVLMLYLRDSYSNGANLNAQNPVMFTEQIQQAGDSLAPNSAVSNLLVMYGTDHMEPSPATSKAIAAANKNLQDYHVLHSTIPNYLAAVQSEIQNQKPEIPTIHGELRSSKRSPLLPGVLSTRMWIKQRNHHSQTLLEKWAEPFSVFAENMIRTESGLGSPEAIASNRIRNVAPILRQAWRLLMENHPHDSICGCSIDQVHDEMKPRFDQTDQIANELILQALQALSRAVDTQSQNGFTAIVLFNPHSAPRRDSVEVALNIPETVAAFELLDADQTVVPHEFIGSSSAELANLLLPKNILRDTIGAITEGRVAGAAITSVKVTRQRETVTIAAILDDKGQPNISAWQQAEADITRYEADPAVTHFHVLAHTPQASKIRFFSPACPALGWRALTVRALPAPAMSPAASVNPLLKPFLPLALRFAQSSLGEKLLAKLSAGDETKPPYVIENEYFRVEVNPDATLTVTDKRTNTIYAGLNRFVDGGDAGDEYNYSPPQRDSFSAPTIATVKVFRHSLIPTLEIEYRLNVPAQLTADRKTRAKASVNISLTSRISLAPGVPRIDIQTEVDNTAKDHRLRVHFPVPFAVDAADYDGHFEVVRRPIGVPESNEKWVEQPRPETHQNAFTSVSNGKIGLTIANRGLPEVEALGARSLKISQSTEIALTLLRSVGWLSRDDMTARQGHAGPGFETPDGQVQGKSVFDYSIIPHAGDWRESYEQAHAFQTELHAVETGIHPGEIPAQGSFISSSPASFIISAVKVAENGKGWLVRGYNISPEPTQVSLKPFRHFARAAQVNLAEETIKDLVSTNDGSVTLPVREHEIVTVLFYES